MARWRLEAVCAPLFVPWARVLARAAEAMGERWQEGSSYGSETDCGLRVRAGAIDAAVLPPFVFKSKMRGFPPILNGEKKSFLGFAPWTVEFGGKKFEYT